MIERFTNIANKCLERASPEYTPRICVADATGSSVNTAYNALPAHRVDQRRANNRPPSTTYQDTRAMWRRHCALHGDRIVMRGSVGPYLLGSKARPTTSIPSARTQGSASTSRRLTLTGTHLTRTKSPFQAVTTTSTSLTRAAIGMRMFKALGLPKRVARTVRGVRWGRGSNLSP
jgi:hypothetical protein